MTTSLTALATALTDVTRGVDFDEDAVLDVARRFSAAIDDASLADREASLALLLTRLQSGGVADADGAAHVALAAGAVVESGLPADALATVLLARLPDVLVAARRYADRCFAQPSMPPADDADDDNEEEEEDEDSDDDILIEVDGRGIPIAVFAAGLDDDRAGAAALYALHEWTLPAVSAWTHSRATLRAALDDKELVAAAQAMQQSSAVWIHKLLGVQLNTRWLVVSPIERRAFRVLVDEVVANFDLHALLAAALLPRGLAGEGNAVAVTDHLSGRDVDVETDSVRGTWDLYDWRGAPLLAAGKEVPSSLWIWGEGEPRDVPMFADERVVVVGPPSYARSWGLGRVFSALRPRIEVVDELDANAVDTWLARAKAAATA
jgi:hypothetical protein